MKKKNTQEITNWSVLFQSKKKGSPRELAVRVSAKNPANARKVAIVVAMADGHEWVMSAQARIRGGV